MKKYIILLLFFVSSSFVALATEVKIIVHPSFAVSSLSEQEIGAIYLGEMKLLKGGSEIIPVVLAEKEIHKRFTRKYTKRSTAQFKTYWRKLLYSGRGKPPRKFKTEAALIEYVAKTPGAIGYVDSATTISGVKELKVK